MNKILVTLAAVAMSAAFAFVGAPTASANDDPGLCWNGVFLEACVSGPGWVDWNPWATGVAIPGTGVGIVITAGSIRSGGS